MFHKAVGRVKHACSRGKQNFMPNNKQEDTMNFIKWQLEAKWENNNQIQDVFTNCLVRYGGDGAQFSCFVLKDGDRMYRLDDTF